MFSTTSLWILLLYQFFFLRRFASKCFPTIYLFFLTWSPLNGNLDRGANIAKNWRRCNAKLHSTFDRRPQRAQFPPWTKYELYALFLRIQCQPANFFNLSKWRQFHQRFISNTTPPMGVSLFILLMINVENVRNILSIYRNWYATKSTRFTLLKISEIQLHQLVAH